MDSNHTDLRRYVTEHLPAVEGWAGSAESIFLLEPLLSLQRDCDELGAFEIGVHHGRYLIALHAACERGSRSLGVDLFEVQAKNVDRSGFGDLATARSNIDKFAPEPHLVDLMMLDSLELTESSLNDIRGRNGGFRLASVDGGHTPIHVVSDTRAAATVVSPGGFVILDDFFHPNFPGVTGGFYRLMETPMVPFIPFLVTRKKLFLRINCRIP